jgi:hypothetical protein
MEKPGKLARQITDFNEDEFNGTNYNDFELASQVISASTLPNVLMIGTGEYTTGFVNGKPSDSDKSAGGIFKHIMLL